MSDFVDGATTPNEEPQVPNTEKTPETVEELANWVGEGKKYKDVNELAKAYKNADQRIEELRLETQRLASEKAEVETKSRSVEEILEALKQPEPVQQAPVQTEKTPTVDIDSLLERKLLERDAATTKKQKVEATWAIMSDAFGDRTNAALAVKAYIGDDEGKKAVINSLAVSDPTGLLKLLGKDVEKKPVSFTDGKSKLSAQVDLSSELTWETAQQVRRSDPKLYYSHEFKQRMINEIPRK